MTYLKEICAIGRRVSNSEGMTKQREYLKKHFTELGATVTLQEFPARDSLTGKAVTLANMIVTWHPDRKERILFCALTIHDHFRIKTHRIKKVCLLGPMMEHRVLR